MFFEKGSSQRKTIGRGSIGNGYEEKLWLVAFYGGALKNPCDGLGYARKRRSRGFRRELHSSNEGGRMFEPEGRVCAGA